MVTNGCGDHSAMVAEECLKWLRAKNIAALHIATKTASRCNALNIAEAYAQGHRIYLDQDARLLPAALEDVRKEFARGFPFVGGRASWRTPSVWVAEAMRVWGEVPYVERSPVTAGMYGISEEGRKRWGRWPDNAPDDKFARLHFRPSERARVDRAIYEVAAAGTVRELCRLRSRYRRSNEQVAAHFPHLAENDLPRSEGLLKVMMQPRNLPGATTLAAAELWARFGRG